MAEELAPIKLGKTQEIESIRVDIADNDGIIISGKPLECLVLVGSG